MKSPQITWTSTCMCLHIDTHTADGKELKGFWVFMISWLSPNLRFLSAELTALSHKSYSAAQVCHARVLVKLDFWFLLLLALKTEIYQNPIFVDYISAEVIPLSLKIYLYHGHQAQEFPSFWTTLRVNGYWYPMLSSLKQKRTQHETMYKTARSPWHNKLCSNLLLRCMKWDHMAAVLFFHLNELSEHENEPIKLCQAYL